MDIAAFDWDDGNRAKCEKHGLRIADIEAMFSRPIAVFPVRPHVSEHRLAAIGMSAEGRHIFIVFTLREHKGEAVIRPISARYMHKKEIEHYEKQAAEAEKAPRAQDR